MAMRRIQNLENVLAENNKALFALSQNSPSVSTHTCPRCGQDTIEVGIGKDVWCESCDAEWDSILLFEKEVNR